MTRHNTTMRRKTVRPGGVTVGLGTTGGAAATPSGYRWSYVPLSPVAHSLDPMRVLGLDPGLTCAGYGLVERTGGHTRCLTFGAIRTPTGPVPGRLLAFHDELAAIIAAHRPDAVAVEKVLFSANTRTAMSVGQAAGVALLIAAQAGCEIAEYTPSELKLSITGDGRADKSQTQFMVQKLLGLDAPPTPVDAADALGLALTHLAAARLKGAAAGVGGAAGA